MKAARLDAFRNVSANGNAHNLSRPFRSIPVAGSKSMLSLYRPDIATMEIGESGAEWSVGVLEYWSDGEVESWIGLLHDSIAPLNAMAEKQAKNKQLLMGSVCACVGRHGGDNAAETNDEHDDSDTARATRGVEVLPR